MTVSDLEKTLKMTRPCSAEDTAELLDVSAEEAAQEFRDLLFRLRRRQAWAGLLQTIERHPDIDFVEFDFDKPSLAQAIQPSAGERSVDVSEEAKERFVISMLPVWEAVGASDAAKTAVAQGFRGMGRGPGEWFAYVLSREDVALVAKKVLENPYVNLEDRALMVRLRQEKLDSVLADASARQKKPRM